MDSEQIIAYIERANRMLEVYSVTEITQVEIEGIMADGQAIVRFLQEEKREPVILKIRAEIEIP